MPILLFFKLSHKVKDKPRLQKFNSQLVRKTSSVNIYSRTYKSPSQADAREVANYGKDDPYTATESNYQYPSMIASSAITGLIGLSISYAIAIPLGSAMARFKNTWIDSFATGDSNFLVGSSNDCPSLYYSFDWFFNRLPRFIPNLGCW